MESKKNLVVYHSPDVEDKDFYEALDILNKIIGNMNHLVDIVCSRGVFKNTAVAIDMPECAKDVCDEEGLCVLIDKFKIMRALLVSTVLDYNKLLQQYAQISKDSDS